MKFLSFLFKKKEIPKVAISEANLYDWFLDTSQERFTAIKRTLREQLGAIESNISDARVHVDKLETAKLQNESIPPKAIHVMQGNRDANIRMTRAFLDAIHPPIEITMEATNVFISNFEEQLANYQKSSAKSHYILQEFFANEAGAVRRGIGRIDEAVRNLLKNDYQKLLTLKKTIIALSKTKQQKVDMQKEIEGLGQEQRIMQNQISENKNSIGAHIKSEEYRCLLELRNQEEEVKGRREKQRDILKGLFSDTDRALRKFVHIERSKEKIVDAYLADPFAALANDMGIDIADVCAQVARSIRTGSIDLKDREKETALRRLDEATRPFFVSYNQALGILEESVTDIGARIRNHRAITKKDDLEYKLDHLRKKSDQTEEKIDELQKKLLSMDTEDYIDIILSETKELLHIELTITPSEVENEDIQVVI